MTTLCLLSVHLTMKVLDDMVIIIRRPVHTLMLLTRLSSLELSALVMAASCDRKPECALAPGNAADRNSTWTREAHSCWHAIQ